MPESLETIHPTQVSGVLLSVNNLSEIAASSANQEAAMGNLKIDNAVPIGVVFPFAGSAAPSGWLLCDGRSLSTTTYAALYAAIGYDYGGSGSSFNIPDLRGRVVAGRDVDRNGYGNRLSSTHFGNNGRTAGQTGGSEGQAITTSQLPSHSHFVVNTDASTSSTPSVSNAQTVTSSNIHSNLDPNYTLNGTATAATVGLSSSTGSGSAHNNVQPTIILNYIIKARFDATVTVP